jgi:hypothetical protein
MGLTRLATAARPAIHKAVDPSRLAVTAALTYPVTDRAGDYVEPAGIDWAVHKADPWVGLEHYRHKGGAWVLPGPGDDHLPPVTVGTARHPDTGKYAVELKAMPEGSIPFGTTYFDPHDRLSSQTFRLVEDGTLEGVSIEFTLRKGYYRELGPSPLEARPAYHVSACTGLGWVHCATPVNPGALLLKSLPPHAEKAIRVVQTGRVGAEPAHPLILKSLSRFAPAGKSNTVTSGYAAAPVRKAMDEQALDPAYDPEETTPEADAPAGGGSTPTVQALYQLAQSLTDLKSQVEELLAGSEHVKGRKYAQKLLADLDGTVEDAAEMAAKIEAELGANADAEPDAEAEEPEPDIADDDTEPDDEGVLKAIRRRPAVFKAIRRFTLAEVRKAAPVEPAAPAVDPELAALVELQTTNPKKYARIVREARDVAAHLS